MTEYEKALAAMVEFPKALKEFNNLLAVQQMQRGFPQPNLALGSLSKSVELNTGAAPKTQIYFNNDTWLADQWITGIMLNPANYGTSLAPSGAATVAVADLQNMYLTLYSNQTEIVSNIHLYTFIRDNTPSGISPVWFPEPLKIDFTRSYVLRAGAAPAANVSLPFVFFYRPQMPVGR